MEVGSSQAKVLRCKANSGDLNVPHPDIRTKLDSTNAKDDSKEKFLSCKKENQSGGGLSKKRNFFTDFGIVVDKQRKPCPPRTPTAAEEKQPDETNFPSTSPHSRCVKQDEERPLDILHLKYPSNNYASTDVDTFFKSLTNMKELMINEDHTHREMCFMASAQGVYLRNGHKPFLPLRRMRRNMDSSFLPIIPDAYFVGLFALGKRDGVNLAVPMALLDDRFPQDRICKNILPAIQHVTGSSMRQVIEFRQLNCFSKLMEHEKFFMLKEKFFEMTHDQRQVAFSENKAYHDKMDLKVERIKQFPMAKHGSFLAFRMTNKLNFDEIVDYALIFGDNINDLKVQTFLEVENLKLAQVALTVIFYDLMAAFCKFSSASKVVNVPEYQKIIDTHLERLCAKTALDELTKDAMPKKSESRKGLSLESGPAKKKLKGEWDDFMRNQKYDWGGQLVKGKTPKIFHLSAIFKVVFRRISSSYEDYFWHFFSYQTLQANGKVVQNTNWYLFLDRRGGDPVNQPLIQESSFYKQSSKKT